MLRNLTMNKQKTILAILLIAITTSLSSAIDYPAQIKPGKANANGVYNNPNSLMLNASDIMLFSSSDLSP